MSIELMAMEAENIRGYTSARLNLEPDRILLVGRNNSGKTSALLLLNWLFNICESDVLEGEKSPSDTDRDILLPARETRNKARRLTLHVRVADGRRHERFKCDEQGIARIRVRIRTTPSLRLFAKLGKPERGENIQSDLQAIRLLRQVKKSFVLSISRRSGMPRLRVSNKRYRMHFKSAFPKKHFTQRKQGPLLPNLNEFLKCTKNSRMSQNI